MSFFMNLDCYYSRQSNTELVKDIYHERNTQAFVSIADIYTAVSIDLRGCLYWTGHYRNPTFGNFIQSLKFKKMDEFILIFRHEDGSQIASPEQMQIWM